MANQKMVFYQISCDNEENLNQGHLDDPADYCLIDSFKATGEMHEVESVLKQRLLDEGWYNTSRGKWYCPACRGQFGNQKSVAPTGNTGRKPSVRRKAAPIAESEGDAVRLVGSIAQKYSQHMKHRHLLRDSDGTAQASVTATQLRRLSEYFRSLSKQSILNNQSLTINP